MIEEEGCPAETGVEGGATSGGLVKKFLEMPGFGNSGLKPCWVDDGGSVVELPLLWWLELISSDSYVSGRELRSGRICCPKTGEGVASSRFVVVSKGDDACGGDAG